MHSHWKSITRPSRELFGQITNNTTAFQSHLRSAGLKRLALSHVLEAQCFSWLGRAGISKDVDGVGCFCKSLPRFEGLRGLAIHFEYNGTFYHVNEPRRWMSNRT